MTHATKHKYVADEVLNDFTLPNDEEGESIVQCLGARGNYILEVRGADGDKYLVSMPTKFRKSIWVKRGDYLLVTPISEGDKVKAEIAKVLYKDQIKYIKSEGQWPEYFDLKEKDKNKGLHDKIEDLKIKSDSEEGSESDSDDDDDLFKNTNRQTVVLPDEDSSSEESESENESEDSDVNPKDRSEA